MKTSFYADNCVTSVQSSQELEKFIKIATSIMAEGKFELRGWEFTGDKDVKPAKILGMLWDKNEGSLSINTTLLEN